MKLIVALVVGCVIVSMGANTSTTDPSTASIVKVTFKQDGELIARMIYTGPDGGPASNPAKYWSLLPKAPESAYEVAIEPDEDSAKKATLKGDITVSVEIRNQFTMGTTRTDKLVLWRDDVDSDLWYIPDVELKRIQPTVSKILIVEEGVFRDGVSKTSAIYVKDDSKIDQLLTMFPECLHRPQGSAAAGWEAGHRVYFFLANGDVVPVTVSINGDAAHWSSGNGDHKTKGDFLSLVEELSK